MKICTAEQMRIIDRAASDLGGIPSVLLMENAAFACVREIKKLNVKKVGIFCGKGNNGGDGLAIARLLFHLGYDVTVFLVFGCDFSGDAFINYDIAEKTGIKITEITDSSDLEYYISAQDLVVDAIFGTGIHGEITGYAFDVIETVNKSAKKVLSVDIPSGVNSDTGEVCKIAVRADITVTFAAYKCGMFLYPGADYTGKIVVSDISIPKYLIEKSIAETIDENFASKVFPKRSDNAHKGDCGKIFIVGGSVGMTGAVTLAAEAAMRSGAGLVTVGIPESLNRIMEVKLTEAMTLPLPEQDGALCPNALDTVLEQMKKSDVLLIGPGMGRSEYTQKLVCDILLNSRIPTIVDADALFAVSQNPDVLDSCSCNLILTPHTAEFARLVNLMPEEKERLPLSAEYASGKGVTLVLKGHHTIVTSPGGKQFINTSGNSGMATGGSGDVLAGMTAAFAASVPDETDAAALAVFLHGLAGDSSVKRLGKTSLTASDICNGISSAITYITTGKSDSNML